jgi:hypothetical protein
MPSTPLGAADALQERSAVNAGRDGGDGEAAPKCEAVAPSEDAVDRSNAPSVSGGGDEGFAAGLASVRTSSGKVRPRT